MPPKKKALPPAPPSQDDRVVAALAHTTVLLPFWGTIGAIVIWATQKDKSRFVAFQSLQAVAYHFALVLAGMLAGACYMCWVFTMPLAMVAAVPSTGPADDVSPAFLLTMAAPFGIMCLTFLGWLAAVVYGLVGAAAALQGKDFRYVWIGRRLEAYLAGS
jgi:uncharacterized Tic20 family protein